MSKFRRLSTPSTSTYVPPNGETWPFTGYEYINKDPAAPDRAPMDTNPVGSVANNPGSFFCAFQDNATSDLQNRPHWALSYNVDVLDDLLHRPVAVVTKVLMGVAFRGLTYCEVTSGYVWTGDAGVIVGNIVKFVYSDQSEYMGYNNLTGPELFHNCTDITQGGLSVLGTGFVLASPGSPVRFVVDSAFSAVMSPHIWYGTRDSWATMPADALLGVQLNPGKAHRALDLVVSALRNMTATRSGASVVGCPAVAGTPFALSAGNLESQLSALVGAINSPAGSNGQIMQWSGTGWVATSLNLLYPDHTTIRPSSTGGPFNILVSGSSNLISGNGGAATLTGGAGAVDGGSAYVFGGNGAATAGNVHIAGGTGIGGSVGYVSVNTNTVVYQTSVVMSGVAIHQNFSVNYPFCRQVTLPSEPYFREYALKVPATVNYHEITYNASSTNGTDYTNDAAGTGKLGAWRLRMSTEGIQLDRKANSAGTWNTWDTDGASFCMASKYTYELEGGLDQMDPSLTWTGVTAGGPAALEVYFSNVPRLAAKYWYAELQCELLDMVHAGLNSAELLRLRFEYRYNGGAWTEVAGSTFRVRGRNLTDDGATQQYLTSARFFGRHLLTGGGTYDVVEYRVAYSTTASSGSWTVYGFAKFYVKLFSTGT